MKSLHGLAAFKSSEILEPSSYSAVAAEYYDAVLHPTCADFREACRLFLQQLVAEERPQGRIADIGCGLSLIAELGLLDVVLVDSSKEMLSLNSNGCEKRCIDVEAGAFGDSEFAWLFAVLADPYNSAAAWRNIRYALCDGGECVFIVPSDVWVRKFRENALNEREGFAHFVLANKSSVFLPSKVYSVEQQEHLIRDSGLTLRKFEQFFVRDLPRVSSQKVSHFLSPNDPIIDVYRSIKK
jgi:SAM-dependent methyltransferase